jgi:aryl-alcohol dehydrogenase-like predicted oxidoreductase
MSNKKLGNSDLMVHPLCLGGNVFGWTIDEKTSFDVLDAYMAAGGNFIDTADAYSVWNGTPGISETILGKWMKEAKTRDRVILATKVGNKMADGKEGLKRAYIMQAVEDSLRRLQTDYIDLYQSHIDDQNTPLEETLGAYNDLIKQGKLRVIGASNYSGKRLTDALAISKQNGWARYECLQPLYNAVKRADYESDLAPVLLAQHVGCIPYSSLASGFLSGKYKQGGEMPQTQRAGGVQNRYMNDDGWNVLAKVEQLAQQHRATPSQIALAWLMAQPSVTSPIASATSVTQLNELMGSVNVKLSVNALN